MRNAVAVIVMLCSAPVHAAEDIGAPQLNVPVSVRQLGMGFVAQAGTDVLRIWSDPSVLTDLSATFEGAILGAQSFGGGTHGALAGAYRLNEAWALGLTVNRHALSFDATDEFGTPTGETNETGVVSAAVSGGWRWDWLRTGLTIKSVSETLLAETSTGIGVDLGLRAVFGDFSGGAAIRNIGGELRAAVDAGTTGDEPAPAAFLPREIRIGAGWHQSEVRLRAGAEAVITKEREAAIGIGAEWWPVPMAGIRAGANLLADATAVTFGLSGVWRGLGLDYAFVMHPVEIRNLVALSYRFGEVAETPRAPREERVTGRTPEPDPEPEPVKPAEGARQLNFAVADLRAENVSAGDAAVMADLLRSELVKTEQFNVVEKQNMDKVLSEHAFQQTGCSTEECAVKLGKLLNVQRMAVGSFGKLLDSYFLNVRVVDIETGKVKYADSAEGKTVSDLKDGVQKLARRLAAKVR